MVESCARAMRRMPVPSLGVAKHSHPIYGATSARLWAIDEYFALDEIDAAAPIVRVLADLASHFVWQASAGVALSDTQMYVVTCRNWFCVTVTIFLNGLS